MMTNYIEVLDPTGSIEQDDIQASSGIGDLDGKVIGLVDNGKPNYDIFVGRVEELLRERYKFADVIHVEKGNDDTGSPLNAEDIKTLVERCDIVLNGICD